MMQIDTSGWTPIGETLNCRMFEVKRRVVAAVPHPGAIDTLQSARINSKFLMDYFKSRGVRGTVIVFLDNYADLDNEARHVYQADADETFISGTCLVGGSLLSRAISSFFLGLTRPKIRVKMVKNVEEAIAWCDALIAADEQARRIP